MSLRGNSTMFIKSNNIIWDSSIRDGILEFQDGIITDLHHEVKGDVIDYGDAFIMPGLIDIHNHGYGGWSFTGTSTLEDLHLLKMRYLSEGVTSVLATASPYAFDTISESVKDKRGCEIVGIHMEGPFLNPEQYGAAPPDTPFPKPSIERLESILKRSKGMLKVMTLAPEMEGSTAVIERLKQEGIKVAVGHSNVSYEQLSNLESPVDLMTHLGNAMSGVHHRNMGALGYGLLEDVMVEVIADGLHLHKPMLDLIFKTKDIDEIILISDTVGLAGCKPGYYRLPTGDVTMTEDGIVINEHGRLSGSSKPLRYDLNYLYQNLKISPVDLAQMASGNPARFLGLEDRGVLRKGKRADCVVFNDIFEVIAVYKEGICVYTHDTEIVRENPKLAEYIKDSEFLNFYGIEKEIDYDNT